MKYTVGVITVSDKGSRGERVDTSGPAICSIMESKGFEVVYTSIIPDEQSQIKSELIKCADELKLSLILTTGGTGFSPRDITPEATLAVIERETRGIPEAMRAGSLKVTPKGCLSRAVAGIRGLSLIINLPGSEKAARENLDSVIDAIDHGLDMLYSAGSADCGEPVVKKKNPPSIDEWLKTAKSEADSNKIGMYLTHNGIVRSIPKKVVREGISDSKTVTGMKLEYDKAIVDKFLDETKKLPGIFYVRLWLNEGELNVGDDIMFVLIGGDIRPNVVDALSFLVGKLKDECLSEIEIY